MQIFRCIAFIMYRSRFYKSINFIKLTSIEPKMLVSHLRRSFLKVGRKLHHHQRELPTVLLHPTCKNAGNIASDLSRDLITIPNFIDDIESKSLISEMAPTLHRLRFEYNHWDNAIHGFKEFEKKQWNVENEIVFDRFRSTVFENSEQIIPEVHVLDVARDGFVKPHVDAIRYCGDKVAVLNMLSDFVIGFKPIDSMDDRDNAYVVIKRNMLFVMRLDL
ncbi:hypothetical protein ACOME3_002462 [Neoechinorhynchus agilis]